MSHTKRGRRSGAGTRLFRFGGAAQPELPGQVGEQKGKLGAAVCGPFRVATVRLGAGGPGEAGPGLARALPAGGCRSPGAILPSDPREAAVRPSGAEWKRRNEGKKEDVLKSQLCGFRCLSLLALPQCTLPRLRSCRSSRACPPLQRPALGVSHAC